MALVAICVVVAIGSFGVGVLLAALRQTAASERRARCAGLELATSAAATVVDARTAPRSVPYDAIGVGPESEWFV